MNMHEERDHLIEEVIKIIKAYIYAWALIASLLMQIEETYRKERLNRSEIKRAMMLLIRNLALKTGMHSTDLHSDYKAGREYMRFCKADRDLPTIVDASKYGLTRRMLNEIVKKDTYSSRLAALDIKLAIDMDVDDDDYAQAVEEREQLKLNAEKARMLAEERAVDTEEDDTPPVKNHEAKIVAQHILVDRTWIPDAIRKKYKPEIYNGYAEFPVRTGTSEFSRRIDVLIYETLTVDNAMDAMIHGIEIKTSEQDFDRDQKWLEYAPFCDYLWICVPYSMADYACRSVPEECGVLAYDMDGEELELEVVRKAAQRIGALRDRTLTKIINEGFEG